jgi:ATP-dependent DNA helicase RecQ
MILHYFGEEFDASNCNEKCDNCKYPKDKLEGKEHILNLLRAVDALHETQKSKHYCAFLSGASNNDIRAYKHNSHELFGVGKENSEHFWNAVIRQSVVAGFLTKDIESYGVLKISDSGRNYMENPHSFPIIKERNYLVIDDEDIISSNAKGGVFDEVLYQQLVDLRKRLSKSKNIPPFVIFQEPSLKDMCLQYPINIEELTNIQGVGNGKAMRYGAPFTSLIKDYVEQNDIERIQDLVVKSVVKKSGLKVQLIQNIDRKLPLEDIGRAQGKEVEEVIDEIEAIVSSGTRVNINYYIDDILDEENQDEIYEYFSEAETDDLKEAYDEFDGDYSEEELRLMRIKFMSEMAN